MITKKERYEQRLIAYENVLKEAKTSPAVCTDVDFIQWIDNAVNYFKQLLRELEPQNDRRY